MLDLNFTDNDNIDLIKGTHISHELYKDIQFIHDKSTNFYQVICINMIILNVICTLDMMVLLLVEHTIELLLQLMKNYDHLFLIYFFLFIEYLTKLFFRIF